MEALGFNVSPFHIPSQFAQLTIQASSGFLEGIVRGYKAGLLTQGAYHNLTQCENLEGESFSVPQFNVSCPLYPIAIFASVVSLAPRFICDQS